MPIEIRLFPPFQPKPWFSIGGDDVPASISFANEENTIEIKTLVIEIKGCSEGLVELNLIGCYSESHLPSFPLFF